MQLPIPLEPFFGEELREVRSGIESHRLPPQRPGQKTPDRVFALESLRKVV
jgi:hypothetical protein